MAATSKFFIDDSLMSRFSAIVVLKTASSEVVGKAVVSMSKATETVMVSVVVGSNVGGLDVGNGVGKCVGFADGRGDGTAVGEFVVNAAN